MVGDDYRLRVEEDTSQPAVNCPATQRESDVLPDLAGGWRRRFRLSERRLLLGAGDLLGLNGALLLALLLRYGEPALDRLLPGWFLLLSAMWLSIAPATECYDLRAASTRRSGAFVALRAGLVVVVLYLMIPYITPPLLDSRAMALTFVLVALFLVTQWRIAYATLVSQPAFRIRSLVVGAGWSGRTIVESIRDHPAYEVVGYVDDDPAKVGTEVSGLPVLAGGDDLMEVVRAQGIEKLVLAITHEMRPEMHRRLLEAFEAGLRVVPMHELYESISHRIAVEHIGGSWYAALPSAGGSGGLLYALFKRATDLLFGFVGTLLFLVALPFLALAIRLDSPGAILYGQERLGRGGRPFQMIKFRSMVADAESNGEAVWASVGDPRVTRVGRVLRATRLDELPQFLCILKGEMSLIGPRPERDAFVKTLEQQIPFYRARLMARPGLTGWAQVMYGYGSSVEDALAKLQYDLYYIKHQSLYLDLVILIKTIGVVLKRAGT